jgi:hypothetical protein
MGLVGKGMMIWQVSRCERGDAGMIATISQKSGFSHVLIKIANGIYAYNLDNTGKIDLVAPVVQALKAKGIQVWGWHYVYGNIPATEAQIAVKRVKELGLDGYVIDAESEYKEPGKEAAAIKFMSVLRQGIPNTPVALCSFRYPSYHPQLPWKAFLDKCDYNMPQVYWQGAHNPGSQLERCVREFRTMTPTRPIIPTGPMYRASPWAPTPEDTLEFLKTARLLNLSAVNFFEWHYGRTVLPSNWNTIVNFPWGPKPQPMELPDLYIAALNTQNTDQIVSLYSADAIHITAERTIQGTEAIRNYYNSLLENSLHGAKFQLTGVSGAGNSRNFSWQAASTRVKIQNGNDTFGIYDGKIAYHYSYYTLNTA